MTEVSVLLTDIEERASVSVLLLERVNINAVTALNAVTYARSVAPSPARLVASRMCARRLPTGTERRRRVERDANRNRSASDERRRHQSFLTPARNSVDGGTAP